MEPGVLEVITRYIKASGQPSDAVTFLTEHYVGAHRLSISTALLQLLRLLLLHRVRRLTVRSR